MGRYLNPSNVGFQKALNSPIYIDKTGMIEKLNQVIGTNEPMVCVSRPRRFGKSMAVNMLTAYYSRGCDSKDLFSGYEISRTADFKVYLNQYDVIRMDMQLMMGEAFEMEGQQSGKTLFRYIRDEIVSELKRSYPECEVMNMPLAKALWNVHEATGTQFIILIDEWDCLFRNYKNDQKLQKEYIDFLRGIFKGIVAEECIALAYITGILPIKKYGTESALNNFKEYTMIAPDYLAEYVGFTEKEVEMLCGRFEMDFEETRKWYDGYYFKEAGHIYSPRSVVEAMKRKTIGSYWTSTETYESLKNYITMDFDGLKEAIARLVAGESYPINTLRFQNDMISMSSKDDVLSLLIHLGYLGYEEKGKAVFIPNEEVKTEFCTAIEDTTWTELIRTLTDSHKLLEKTWAADETAVAEILERVHEENVSILNYNDENALSFIVSLAYISARKDYVIVRELPGGKGFADIVFIPRKQTDKPAMVVELKWDKTVDTAITQIKEKRYVHALKGYVGTVLLVGINYNKESKMHQCKIEEYQKGR